MSRRVDEEQATVYSGIGNMSVPLGSEFFPQVARVLVFNLNTRASVTCCSRYQGCMPTHVSRDGLPASIVVDLISVSRRVDDVQLESDSVLDDSYLRGMS